MDHMCWAKARKENQVWVTCRTVVNFLHTDPSQSSQAPASSRGSGRCPDRAAEPRAQRKDTKHSGAEPHRGETAEGEEEHAVCPQHTSTDPIHRDQAAGRTCQNTLLCCCSRDMWSEGDISSCSVWEDLPAHRVHRYQCGRSVMVEYLLRAYAECLHTPFIFALYSIPEMQL